MFCDDMEKMFGCLVFFLALGGMAIGGFIVWLIMR